MPGILTILCRCFGELDSALDLSGIRARLEAHPDVASVEMADSLCLPGDVGAMVSRVRGTCVEKVLIGCCSPFGRGDLLRSELIREGLTSSFVRSVDLREGCAWIHAKDSAGARKKAWNLLDMGLASLRHAGPSGDVAIRVQPRALVIGAGPAGLSSAVSLAGMGFPTHLVERTAAAGGLLNLVSRTYPSGESGPEKMKDFIEEVGRNPLIAFHPGARIESVKGYAGDFKVRITSTSGGGPQSLRVGAIVVATGARVLLPRGMMGYGSRRNVITQMEMERRFSTGKADCTSAVFLQCSGARSSERPYCSTLCCPLSLKNAMRVLEEVPGAKAFVLHRDIMTPGSVLEAYYRKALQMGVQFIRFDPLKPPDILGADGFEGVEVDDAVAGVRKRITADLLVLSTPLVPDPENQKLARILGLPLDRYGFFQEAYPLHPVETRLDGIFICGAARWPVSSDQAIQQGGTAAMKAAAVLSRETISALSQSCVPGMKAGHARVNAEHCTGCGNCAAVCPFDACRLQKMDGRSVSRVIKVRCKACGNCISVCPNGAMQVPEYSDRVLGEMIRRAFKEVP
jgi:heterodisulfide reductase subunit A